MSIADKLLKLADTKTRIREACNDVGIGVSESDTFASYPDKIRGQVSSWTPPADWWDIESILLSDTRDYAGKAIILLTDAYNTIALSGWSAYATSDGAFYTANATHTWDASQDKPCSEGYKTRYIIVYTSAANYAHAYTAVPSNVLYAIYRGVNFSSYAVGNATNSYSRLLLRAVRFIDCGGSITNLNNAFYYCRSLVYVEFPAGWVDMISVDNAFFACLSLQFVLFPDTWTKMTSIVGMFKYCYGLKSVLLPDTWVNMTRIDYMCDYCRALCYIVLPDTWVNMTTMTYAFRECFCLQAFPMPETWTKMVDMAFAFIGAIGLKGITLPTTWPKVSIYSAFDSCTTIQRINIPGEIITSAAYAFNNLSSLINISLPGIKVSFGVPHTALGYPVLLNLINDLGIPASAQTCTLGSTNLVLLQSTQEGLDAIAAAQVKGWTIN